jgi:cobyrinic acid a,c-diamide synthase
VLGSSPFWSKVSGKVWHRERSDIQRHTTPPEARVDYVDQLALLIEEHIDLDALLANSAIERRTASAAAAASSAPPRVRLALAPRRSVLLLLHRQPRTARTSRSGTRPVPTHRRPLPENIDGIDLGGGYPELHADKLAANTATREAIRDFASAGGPIYAECGGLMFLAQTLELNGDIHPLCGVLPFSTTMAAPLTIG